MRHFLAVIISSVAFTQIISAQENPYGDPTIAALEASGLIQDLNLTQESGDIIVTIERFFVDAQRIGIWMTVEGIEIPEGNLHGGSIINVTPTFADGTFFQIGGGGGGYDRIDDTTWRGQWFFDHSIPVDDTTTLDLALNVQIGTFQGTSVYLTPVDLVLDGTVDLDEYEYDFPYFEQFKFEVSSEVAPALIIKPDLAVTDNDLTITLEELSFSTSQTKAEICYDLPDGGDWQPSTTLEIDGEIASISSYSLIGLPDPTQTNRCVTISYILPYDADAETVILTVFELKTSIPEFDLEAFDRAERRLAEIGIIVEFERTPGQLNYTIISSREDFEPEQIGRFVITALSDIYKGEWVFEIDLREIE